MSTQTIKSPLQVGSRLPNGATVIEFEITTSFSDAAGRLMKFGKCLAVCTCDLSADPYVSWKFSIHPNGNIDTHNGHYHDTLRSALEDYESRL